MKTCPACGYITLPTHSPGSGETCDVCGWVDDFQQLVHPDITYGANGLCLRQAQHNFLAGLAVCPPAAAYEHDVQWRPLMPGESPPWDDAAPSSPTCYLAMPDPEDYVPYWLRGQANTPTVW